MQGPFLPEKVKIFFYILMLPGTGANTSAPPDFCLSTVTIKRQCKDVGQKMPRRHITSHHATTVVSNMWSGKFATQSLHHSRKVCGVFLQNS